MMVEIKDLRDSKRLAATTWDALSPPDQQRALSLLGTMYRNYDDLATYTAFANGRIERLREVLSMAIADQQGWRDEARAALRATEPQEAPK